MQSPRCGLIESRSHCSNQTSVGREGGFVFLIYFAVINPIISQWPLTRDREKKTKKKTRFTEPCPVVHAMLIMTILTVHNLSK